MRSLSAWWERRNQRWVGEQRAKPSTLLEDSQTRDQTFPTKDHGLVRVVYYLNMEVSWRSRLGSADGFTVAVMSEGYPAETILYSEVVETDWQAKRRLQEFVKHLKAGGWIDDLPRQSRS